MSVSLRLVRVAANFGLPNLYNEHAEIAELDLVALGQRFGDVIQGLLNHIQDLVLNQPGFLVDANDEFAFGQSHGRLLMQFRPGVQRADGKKLRLRPQPSWATSSQNATGPERIVKLAHLIALVTSCS